MLGEGKADKTTVGRTRRIALSFRMLALRIRLCHRSPHPPHCTALGFGPDLPAALPSDDECCEQSPDVEKQLRRAKDEHNVPEVKVVALVDHSQREQQARYCVHGHV